MLSDNAIDTVLVMADSNVMSDPRPRRTIGWLSDRFRVSVISTHGGDIHGAKFLSFKPRTRAAKVREVLRLLRRDFDGYLSDARDRLPAGLDELRFAAVVVHDLVLLPAALEISQGAPVILDAREFYPRQFEDRRVWRFLRQGLNEYMARKYLSECSAIVTVSEGLGDGYRDEYGVATTVIPSFRDFHDLDPMAVSDNSIRLLYHGAANPSRQVHKMVEMMDNLDDRFSLDLVLLPSRSRYFRRLAKLAATKDQVRILQPVQFDELVVFGNAYDIGVFLVPPSTFNLRFVLPNKFFEFVQSRLAVAIGPSPEMVRYVDEFGFGVHSDDFDPRSLARVLNNLSAADVFAMKQAADQAAGSLNDEAARLMFFQVLDRVLGP